MDEDNNDECKIVLVKKGRRKIKHEPVESTKRSAADSARHKIRLVTNYVDGSDSESTEQSEESSSDEEFGQESELDDESLTSSSDESSCSMEEDDLTDNESNNHESSSSPTNSHQIEAPKLEPTKNSSHSIESTNNVVPDPVINVKNESSYSPTSDSDENSNSAQPSTSQQISQPSTSQQISQSSTSQQISQPSTSRQISSSRKNLKQTTSLSENALNQKILGILADYKQTIQQNPELAKPVEVKKKMTCQKCQNLRFIHQQDFCFVCCKEMAKNRELEMEEWKYCNRCNRFRKHEQRGYCPLCLPKILEQEKKVRLRKDKMNEKRRKENETVCNDCGVLKSCLYRKKTLCKECYERKVDKFCKPKKKKSPTKKNNLSVCIECEKLKPHAGRGLCPNCYQRVFCNQKKIAKRRTAQYKESNLRKCVECGEMKRHEARGMCFHCAKRFIYNPNYYKASKERKVNDKAKKSSETQAILSSNNPTSTSNESRINLSSGSENEDDKIRKEIKDELQSKLEAHN